MRLEAVASRPCYPGSEVLDFVERGALSSAVSWNAGIDAVSSKLAHLSPRAAAVGEDRHRSD
jgi:hypothetical protein